MREIRPSGSEGGGALTGSPYPYRYRRARGYNWWVPGNSSKDIEQSDHACQVIKGRYASVLVCAHRETNVSSLPTRHDMLGQR
jgi:hypothetical protein